MSYHLADSDKTEHNNKQE